MNKVYQIKVYKQLTYQEGYETLTYIYETKLFNNLRDVYKFLYFSPYFKSLKKLNKITKELNMFPFQYYMFKYLMLILYIKKNHNGQTTDTIYLPKYDYEKFLKIYNKYNNDDINNDEFFNRFINEYKSDSINIDIDIMNIIEQEIKNISDNLNKIFTNIGEKYLEIFIHEELFDNYDKIEINSFDIITNKETNLTTYFKGILDAGDPSDFTYIAHTDISIPDFFYNNMCQFLFRHTKNLENIEKNLNHELLSLSNEKIFQIEDINNMIKTYYFGSKKGSKKKYKKRSNKKRSNVIQ